jgi:spoIIIJ-associated protein
MKQETFTAKTLERAKQLASQKFGVDESSIAFKVLEEPKKKFFGIQKGEYVIEATYVDVEPEHEVSESPVTPTLQEVVEPTTTDTTELPTQEDTTDTTEPAVEEIVTTEPVTQPAEESTAPVEPLESEESPAEETEEATAETVPTKDEILEKARVAQEYVGAILSKMGIDPASEVTVTDNGAVIDFKGDGTGTIIGKRGETLDALQYLSAMICNKGEKDYYRITLDSCGYRAKRKVILEELAKKVSKNVLRTGRSQSLEPMNPYERRIIHATISEIDGVTSRSIGEEPFRKVIISSTNPKKYNNRKGGYNGHSKRGGNNKYRGNGKKKPYQPPRSLDLKTSFEKDYRKPKPEDNLKEGLYGKIEL